jgi:hypothetical protein
MFASDLYGDNMTSGITKLQAEYGVKYDFSAPCVQQSKENCLSHLHTYILQSI